MAIVEAKLAMDGLMAFHKIVSIKLKSSAFMRKANRDDSWFWYGIVLNEKSFQVTFMLTLIYLNLFGEAVLSDCLPCVKICYTIL